MPGLQPSDYPYIAPNFLARQQAIKTFQSLVFYPEITIFWPLKTQGLADLRLNHV